MLDRWSYFLCNKPLPGPEPKAVFAERRLREAILWCEIEPGAVVSEDMLVKRLGLARAATRAALARLAGEGLVQAIPRRGWRVQAMTGALIGELIAARRSTEPALAELSFTAAEITRMRELACIVEAAAQQDDPRSMATARQYERELLTLMAGRANMFQQRWLHELWDHTERVVRFFEGTGAARLPMQDAAPLVAAAAAGDRDGVLAQRTATIEAFERFVSLCLLSHQGELTVREEETLRPRPDGENTKRLLSRESSKRIVKRKETYQ